MYIPLRQDSGSPDNKSPGLGMLLGKQQLLFRLPHLFRDKGGRYHKKLPDMILPALLIHCFELLYGTLLLTIIRISHDMPNRCKIIGPEQLLVGGGTGF